MVWRLTPACVRDALAARDALRLESLDALARREARSVADLGANEPGFELIEQRAAFERTWGSLHPRERECLRLRFAGDFTYAENR